MSATAPATSTPAASAPVAGSTPALKADVLVEALPYIRRFAGKTVVV